MDGAHVDPAWLMAMFIEELKAKNTSKILQKPTSWSIPNIYRYEPPSDKWYSFGINEGMLDSNGPAGDGYPVDLELLSYLDEKYEFVIAVYRNYGRIQGQQICLATSKGCDYIPGDNSRISFKPFHSRRIPSPDYAPKAWEDAAQLVSVVDALYHGEDVPVVDYTVRAAGLTWGLWEAEETQIKTGLFGTDFPLRKPTRITKAGITWFRQLRRSEGVEIYKEGAPKEDVAPVTFGDNAFVSIVGDNAQSVAVGHGAQASSTSDAELIGMIVAALNATGHTKDAETLRVVAENAGPDHPATVAVGKSIWSGAKDVLTAALPPTITALFKALIGL